VPVAFDEPLFLPAEAFAIEAPLSRTTRSSSRSRRIRGYVGTMTTAAPVIFGFDGSAAAERAVRDAAPLLGHQPALVVTVWEAGRRFEATTLPVTGLDLLPPTVLDLRGAVDADTDVYEAAERTARHGAHLARDAGFTEATGLAVADELTVADTLIRVARERGSPGIVVGAHGHRKLSELLLGSTSDSLVHKADRPVVVVRAHTREP
jgi:nucleotide-binding universal stress UspA family protein